jgi:ParB/RepB/Spo0J family partition protein
MKKQSAAKGKTQTKKVTTKNKQQMTATKTESTPVKETAAKDRFVLLPPSVLVPNPENPRIVYAEIEELMNSILENGLLDPLTGYYKGDKVILKDGHRRMKAIQLAFEKGHKIERVPVIIVSPPSKEQETLDYIIHNDGKPLTMLEQSVVIGRLLNFGWKPADIAKKTGKAPGYIANLIMLTKAPMKVINHIKDDKISAHAVVQIMAASKGDAELVVKEVETALQKAKEAGKEKATPKHVENKQVKGQSYGKFYKFIEEIVDLLAGRKDTYKEKEMVLSDMLVAFENGQKAKEVAARYFIDKSKSAAEVIKNQGKKPEVKRTKSAIAAKKTSKK